MSSSPQIERNRAPRNRTLVVDQTEVPTLRSSLVYDVRTIEDVKNRIICGDALQVLHQFTGRPQFDLLFADPPYNLTKSFGKEAFNEIPLSAYADWLDSWLGLCVPNLKRTSSVYICGDWRSGAAIQQVGTKYFQLRNRITWEREKGRGARANWKNSAEDIWFFTVADEYTFNLNAVKQRRRVLAPYKQDGRPKDWTEGKNGNYRDTHPSNIWTDITVPFWSMPENTDHPTQKPEKLLAKIILASTNPGDLILDPFAGSGTSAVTAKKLARNFVVIESDEQYCLLAQKRLLLAETETAIQGFADGVFWDRNASPKGP